MYPLFHPVSVHIGEGLFVSLVSSHVFELREFGKAIPMTYSLRSLLLRFTQRHSGNRDCTAVVSKNQILAYLPDAVYQ